MESKNDKTKKRRLEIGRSPSFKIEIPGDESQKEILLGKWKSVKSRVKGNNANVMEVLLDFWLTNNSDEISVDNCKKDPKLAPSFVSCQRKNMFQEIFVCSKDSISALVDQVSAVKNF